MSEKIVRISAKAVPVRGNDIDTDRIIPARYLRCVSFDGLKGHAFEDDRAQMNAKGKVHPLDNPKFKDARILVSGSNFGCGSSREHAPQALLRWNKGIQAVVAESFAEIFFGNCVTLGIPCLGAGQADIETLSKAVEENPELQVEVNLESMTVTFGDKSVPVVMIDGPRQQLMQGKYDPTAELLEAKDQILATAKNIPYFNW